MVVLDYVSSGGGDVEGLVKVMVLTVKKDMGRKRMVTSVSCFMLSF